MGNYCNQLPDGTRLPIWGKADVIAKLPTAKELERLPELIDYIAKDKIAVVVADAGSYEAALICDTQRSLERPRRAKAMGDPRDYRFFLIDRDDVRAMADEPLESEKEV